MVKTNVLIITLLVLMTACVGKKLYQQNIKNSTILNIDGVYINQKDFENPQEKYCSIILLYENSLIRKGLVRRVDVIEDFNSTIESFGHLSRDSKTSYGIYQIEGANIHLEFWSPPSFGQPINTVTNRGKLLDDKSFIINYMRSNYDGKELPVSNIYKFYPLKNKPDSANRFIRTAKK